MADLDSFEPLAERLRRKPELTDPQVTHSSPQGGECAYSLNLPLRREIEEARTANGGWTKEQLEKWGVPWPPPKGWRKRLEAQR